jgi:hypothetical protein
MLWVGYAKLDRSYLKRRPRSGAFVPPPLLRILARFRSLARWETARTNLARSDPRPRFARTLARSSSLRLDQSHSSLARCAREFTPLLRTGQL